MLKGLPRKRARAWILITAIALLPFFVSSSHVAAQCIDNCQNPNLIDHYTQHAGCWSCQFFSNYYTITETWVYSCTNGGTCTVRETYDAPCGVCPW